MADPITVAGELVVGPPEAPSLVAGRCDSCREFHFPPQPNCPLCGALRINPTPLSRRGTLWTWTIQTFPPPAPPFRGNVENFAPFGVGYVEFPEGVRVEGRLTIADERALRIGMPVEVAIASYGSDGTGRELRGFAFAPVAPGTEQS